MALTSINDIGPGKTLTPNSELARINGIRANRSLYDGDFRALGIGMVSEEDAPVPIPGLRVNWFRRVARFYPEFMLSEVPVVTVEGNPRLEDFIADRASSVWCEIAEANTDAIRFGYGVIASLPSDPTFMWSVEPDSHYEVHDERGEVTHDLILRKRFTSDNENGALDLYVYPVADDEAAVRRIYRLAAGVVGDLMETELLPPRTGRQVVLLPLNRERESWYADIRDSVGEISRGLTSLAGTLRRNHRPHLYGPADILQTDERGRATIEVDGQFFPLQDGDSPPGYLQWDSKIDAVKFDIDTHLTNIYAMTGLNRLLFDGERAGVATGAALRRLLLPFVARLNHLKTLNDRAFAEVLALMVRNHAAGGGELYAYDQRGVTVSYGFEAVFTDPEATVGGSDDGSAGAGRE